MSDMIVSIIGSGAVGKSYGGLLSLANNEVHYLMRSEYAQIQKSGYFELRFEDPLQTIRIENPIIHSDPLTLPPSDLIIISLKTTENQTIASLLKSCLKADSTVLIIQNGIGNEEWISDFTKNCPVICGISTIGAHRPDAITVQISFFGELKLAPYQLKDLEICKALSETLSIALKKHVSVYNNYKEIRWQKLLWNVPFASLSIIYDKNTETLASMQPYVSIVRNLMNEVIEVAAADGVKIPKDFSEKMLAASQKANNYYPSMYRDYVEGKPIEKEYIIDNVLKIARKHDIKTPMLNLIETNLAKN
jgi:2-dehydropantoate 2-reductase